MNLGKDHTVLNEVVVQVGLVTMKLLPISSDKNKQKKQQENESEDSEHRMGLISEEYQTCSRSLYCPMSMRRFLGLYKFITNNSCVSVHEQSINIFKIKYNSLRRYKGG